MKKLYTSLVAVFLTASVFLPQQAGAQSPEKMSYQAVIRDSSDNLVIETQVGMQISILQGSVSGTAVYVETQSPTTNTNGLVSIEIGSAVGFSSINWANGPYFIKTEIDPSGGKNYTITGTSQLLSVPYALYAKTAETAVGMPTSISDLSMNANSQNITNLADPINNQDAATKAYVTLKVSKTGDTLFLGREQYVIIPGISEANTIPEISEANTFTDSRDGNIYSYVSIGSQVWMAENLAYLPSVNQVADGSEDEPGSYYYVSGYDGTNVTDAKATSNYRTYGVLYNWTAAMNACPSGWHLPSDAEWTQLTDYLGGRSVAGGKLKETGTAHWADPNTGATNESGFTARPGGARYTYTPSGSFYALNIMAYFQTSTEGGEDLKYAYRRGISNSKTGVSRTLTDAFKESAFSVRCVKD